MKNERIRKYIFDFKLTKEQENNIINKHYHNNENDRLELFGILYEFIYTEILNRYKVDITENSLFDEYINNTINDLVLKYVF